MPISGQKRSRADLAADDVRHIIRGDSGGPSQSWRALVLRIGERCAEYGGHNNDVKEHLETCAGAICRELAAVRDDVIQMIMQCAQEIPHKAPLHATLVALVNLEDPEVGAAVVERTMAGLQVALDEADCHKLRLLLRFLTLLASSGVVPSKSLIEIYDALLAGAAAILHMPSGNPAWQPQGDFYAFCVLAALPFGAVDLAEKAPDELERLMLALGAYMSSRQAAAYPALAVFSGQEGSNPRLEVEDRLVDLWESVQALQAASWKVSSVPAPQAALSSLLADGKEHAPVPLTMPPVPQPLANPTGPAVAHQHFLALQAYPLRHRRLRIFPASKTEAGMTPIDRFLVEEYLLDVLLYLDGSRKECAAYMVGLPVPFRYEYLMAETVFSQLLMLPKPPRRLIFYTVVMIDLCKALPGAFPAVVAGAVRSLFGRVAAMDTECRTRLVQWLSHHLSNFAFVWPWEGWAKVLEMPVWAPQRVFCSEVLEKEVRLAYWDKIKENLKSARMVDLLPPRGTPSYRYSGPPASETEVALAKEMAGLVRSKKSSRDLETWAMTILVPALGPLPAVDITVQTLLHLGAKSFTHTVTLLERYGQLLHRLAPDQAMQEALVHSVAALWQNSPQLTSIVIDRCMGFRIVSSLAIVGWAFSPPSQRLFHVSDRVWEVLRNAINKTNNRVVDLRREAVSAQAAASAASAAASKAAADSEVAEGLAERETEEEARSQAVAKAEWAKGKAERAAEDATSAQEGLEAKEALLERALKEQEGLFISIFSNFVAVLGPRLAKADSAAAGSTESEGTAIPSAEKGEGTTPMDATEDGADDDVEADDEERRKKRLARSGTNGRSEGAQGDAPMADDGPEGTVTALAELAAEEEQDWLRCTLGQLHALSRHNAAEVWQAMDKLDLQVFTPDVDQRIIKAVYSGLRRPLKSAG